jgi:ElaB/YqjD/DUF883 family membrane-anchored ribosome-binding protein
VTADVVVSRELKSLQDELSAGQQKRSAAPTAAPTPPPATAEPLNDRVEEHELRDHLRELTNEVTSFFEDAEKGISAHPTQSVVGALLVGILIGRLLGRR